MAIPTTRQELKEYALRALGSPVIEINVEDSQLEDRMDEALQWFAEMSSEGFQRQYYKYQITQQDRDNKYISTDAIDTRLISVTKVFQAGFNMQVNNIFNIRYQLALNDFYGVRNGQINLTHFTTAMQYIELLQQLLDPEKQIRFNRHSNKLVIDTNITDGFIVGRFLLIEGYTTLDPDAAREIYGDILLKKYVTALIKRQWGINLSKYEGIAMPGNMTFNGTKIYTEAIREITELEEQTVLRYQEPPDFITG